jgi:hypothetical protein
VSREVSPDTVNKYLTGIVHFLQHKFPFVVQARHSTEVKTSVRGCLKTRSLPTKRANAFTIRDVETSAYFFNSTFDDALFNVILAMGFAALHRLGELTVPDSVGLRNNRKTIRRSSVIFSICGTVLCYNLPYHKADPLFKGTPVAIADRPGDKTCPIRTILHYTHYRDKKFPYHPYFLLRENGSQPTRSWFMNRLEQIFGKERTGHSLRAGGATAFAQAGMEMETIQAIGRWSSEAFKAYIRTHPILNLNKTQRCVQTAGFTTGKQIEFPGAVIVSLPNSHVPHIAKFQDFSPCHVIILMFSISILLPQPWASKKQSPLLTRFVRGSVE